MTVADIQDNKWERESIRPPIRSAGAIGVIIMMTCFALFFVAIIIGSVVGSFTDTQIMDFEGKAPEASTPEAE
jgi:hypothetical protein